MVDTVNGQCGLHVLHSATKESKKEQDYAIHQLQDVVVILVILQCQKLKRRFAKETVKVGSVTTYYSLVRDFMC